MITAIGVCTLLLLLINECSAWSDPPSPDDFIRRSGAQETACNDTVAIDISKSWDPKNVAFLKPNPVSTKPSVYRSSLVVDDNEKYIYLWGGRGPRTAPDRLLWKFEPDNKGNGKWNADLTVRMDDVVRTEASAYTTAHGLGFWFGGSINQQTDKTSKARNSEGTEVPGFVTFNFTAKEWTKHTEVPESIRSPYATTATYVPSLGPNGIIVFLGGLTKANRLPSFDFRTIHFMDPVTMKWYNQTALGNLPNQRMDHCAVGAQGENNTFEIFVYGRQDKDNPGDQGQGEVYGDVWILSLPGFIWYRANTGDGDIRTHHACVRVGKRQMLSVGGVDRTIEPVMMTIQDPRPQGLGIFDMTEMKWTGNYNADAPPYTTPEVIRRWYIDGGLNSVRWSVGVQDLFQNKTPSQPDIYNSPHPAHGSGGLSTEAIVGIVGAFAGIAAITAIGVAFLFQKRRRKETNEPMSALGSTPAACTPVEMYSAHPELGGDTQPIAMRASLLVPGYIPTNRQVELHANERSEMVG